VAAGGHAGPSEAIIVSDERPIPAFPVEVYAGGPSPTSAGRRASDAGMEILRHTLLGVVPVVGPTIDAVVTAWERQRADAAHDELLRELCAMVGRLEADKVDIRYLESEEYRDRFAKAWRLAEDTRDQAKIRLYAAILAGAARIDRDEFLEPESTLSALAELSPGDLMVLEDFWQHRGQQGASEFIEYQYEPAQVDPRLPRALHGHVLFHLLRLERAGLVKEAAGAIVGYTGGGFSATPTLCALMALVAQLGDSLPDGGAEDGLPSDS